MPTRSMSLAALLAVLALAAAGCGDDDSDDGGDSGGSGSGGEARESGGSYGNSGGGDEKTDTNAASGGAPAGALRLVADPSGALKFDKTRLETKPGKVAIVLANPSDVPHAIEVEGNGVEAEGETVGKGGVSKVAVELEPGEYEYYCPVGNHKDAGMEGTLTVG